MIIFEIIIIIILLTVLKVGHCITASSMPGAGVSQIFNFSIFIFYLFFFHLFRRCLFSNGEEFEPFFLTCFCFAEHYLRVIDLGLVKSMLQQCGYPAPEILYVLKNPSSKMVIDMKPGGATDLTTCSINSIHIVCHEGA